MSTSTSKWTVEMDRRLQLMDKDPQAYADAARKAAKSGRVTLVGVRKGSGRTRLLRRARKAQGAAGASA